MHNKKIQTKTQMLQEKKVKDMQNSQLRVIFQKKAQVCSFLTPSWLRMDSGGSKYKSIRRPFWNSDFEWFGFGMVGHSYGYVYVLELTKKPSKQNGG